MTTLEIANTEFSNLNEKLLLRKRLLPTLNVLMDFSKRLVAGAEQCFLLLKCVAMKLA